MTKRTFFHPQIGVFVDLADSADQPENSLEIPNAPSPNHVWDGNGWNYVAPPVVAPVLSPVRFAYLLAFTGLDDVWDALETSLKETDRAAFAVLRAQRAKSQFHLDTTLALVAQHREAAAAAFPGADLSERAIREAWELAAEAQL